MSYDYSRLRGTASRLIARFGAPATLSRIKPGTEPQNPWDPPMASEVLTFPVTAVDTGTSTRYAKDAVGALIPRLVRVILIAAADATPQMGDRIEVAGGSHEIARVERIQPGDTALLFEVEISA